MAIRSFLFFCIILIATSIFFHNKNRKNECFHKCAIFHLNGEADFWKYSEYIIMENDTVWIDKECYNLWCICMDECKPGLCCEFLN